MSAHPARPRRHRSRPHREVRGLLPRPRRQPARQGGLGRRHVRRARQPGRAGRARRPHRRRCRSTTSTRSGGVLAARGGEVAAVIVEPVAGNMGVVPPAPGFLAGLRELATRHGALLDLRRGHHRLPRGAAAGPRPSTACGRTSRASARSSAAGCPVGAYGGRARPHGARLAARAACTRPGTLSGNPLAVAAGLATLRALRRPARVRAARGAGRAAGARTPRPRRARGRAGRRSTASARC